MKTKLGKLKQKFMDHFSILTTIVFNSFQISNDELNPLAGTINALIKIIDKQIILIKKSSRSSLLKKEYISILDSQKAKLMESLDCLKNIKTNKNKLMDLRYKIVDELYEEEKSFYSEFL